MNIGLLLYKIKNRLSEIYGFRNVVILKLWRVQIGSSPLFRGRTYFRKYESSTIKIGNNFKCISNVNSASIIRRPCTIETNSQNAFLEIGNNVSMSGSVIACFKHIFIEDNVRIGGDCIIMDGDFHTTDLRTSAPKEIHIKKNVWIGYSSIILKGVTIGENSVIGANSVVTKDIPGNCIAVGNPCKVIKYLER